MGQGGQPKLFLAEICGINCCVMRRIGMWSECCVCLRKKGGCINDYTLANSHFQRFLDSGFLLFVVFFKFIHEICK